MNTPGNRDDQGRFVPGKSGNPDGRPAIAKLVRELCRENEEGRIEDVIKELYAIALRGKGMVKLEAIRYLIDRVAGKPAQAITGEDGAPLSMGVILLPADDPGK